MINIYMLFDEVLKQPVYVGGTINMLSRFSAHKRNKFKGYKNKLSIQLLNKTELCDAAKEEEFWYWQLRSFGFNLNQSYKKWYATGKGVFKDYETIKLEDTLVEKVRTQKKQTGIPMSVFITQAVIEKLEKQVKNKPTKTK